MNNATKTLDLNEKYGPFFTKDGRKISLVIDEDIQDPKRPFQEWMCHEVRAYVDGKEAGYLRIAHVTREKVESLLPTVWHYMQRFKGWCIDIDKPLKLWRQVHNYANARAQSRPFLPSGGLCYEEPDMQTIMMDLFALDASCGFSAKFKEWQDENIGYAFVDFSQAHNNYDEERNEDRINCRGMGVGFAMYAFAGQWLADNYWLELHSAVNPSEGATACWKRLVAAGYPVKMKRVKRMGRYQRAYTFGMR